jgi:hypothetical protein
MALQENLAVDIERSLRPKRLNIALDQILVSRGKAIRSYEIVPFPLILPIQHPRFLLLQRGTDLLLAPLPHPLRRGGRILLKALVVFALKSCLRLALLRYWIDVGAWLSDGLLDAVETIPEFPVLLPQSSESVAAPRGTGRGFYLAFFIFFVRAFDIGFFAFGEGFFFVKLPICAEVVIPDFI